MDGSTLGVEEEFLIVDRASGELAARSGELLPLARNRLGDEVAIELNRCLIETATPVCASLDEIRLHLDVLRTGLDEAAAELDCGIAALGTHPWSSWEDQEVERDRARFRAMEDRYQQVARQQVICGCHVHVGVEDPDDAVRVTTAIRPWLPVLLALSANSPFWLGDDTGYDSYRFEIWARWPTAGMPPRLEDRAAFDGLVGELQEAGAIEDPTHLYWWARPSMRYPTVEVRVADVGLTCDDAVVVAGLARGLVRTHVAGRSEPPAASLPVLEAAAWRAARYGVAGELVSPVDGVSRPAVEVVGELLDHVADALDELGDREQVTELVTRILRDGNGAGRQRATRRREGLAGVVAGGRIGATAGS